MVWIFNSLSLPRKKSTLVLPVLSSRYPVSHRRGAGVAQGMDAQNIQQFGILSGLPWGVLGSLVWVPGQNGRWFPPLKSCGCCTSEFCLLRSVSQAMVCNCAVDKMGETGKTVKNPKLLNVANCGKGAAVAIPAHDALLSFPRKCYWM